MMYDRILIRYGEISTKGKNRNKFIDKLKKSVRRAISDFPNAVVESERDRMHVLLKGEDGQLVGERLKKVFGIQSYSLAVKTEKDVEKMKETALQLFRELYKEGNTFKISAKRSDKTFELDSNEMNAEFGGFLLRNTPGLTVDVHQPDINLQIEVRNDAVYLSAGNIPGAGGLPVGSSGKAMLMLSGGIDSPVAGFLTMKRGVEIEAVHFASPPFTSERAKQKVIDLTEKLSHISGHINLHIVPFTEIQQMIHKQIPSNYTMTTTRRLMLQITDLLREQKGGLAIVTGESLGQVASQTLESMYAINHVTSTPILRPLIHMDKTEIMEIATEIDTLEISNLPYEDCCTVFVPSSPKTKPKLEKVQHYESYTDFSPLVEKAVADTETIFVKPGKNQEFEEDLF